MSAKRYLNQYRYIPNDIESLMLRIKEEKELAKSIKSIDYSKERIQVTTGNEAKFEKQIEKIREIEAESEKKIKRYFHIMANCEKLLDSIEDPMQRNILKYKFVNGMNMDSIALRLDITRQWTTALYGKALTEIEIIAKKLGISLQ